MNNTENLWLYKYGLVITLGVTIVLYFLLDRKGRKLDKVIADAKLATIGNQLMDLATKASRSEEEYRKAYEKYKVISNMYPDIVNGLGLHFGSKTEQ